MMINRRGREQEQILRDEFPLICPLTTYLKVYHNVLVFKLDEVMTIKVFGPFL